MQGYVRGVKHNYWNLEECVTLIVGVFPSLTKDKKLRLNLPLVRRLFNTHFYTEKEYQPFYLFFRRVMGLDF